jgi:ABC-type transport system involved in multi-copper enzyme maturation permease subunit
MAIRALSAILPDLENFNFRTEIVHGLAIDPKFYLFSGLYGVVYTLFILSLAVLVFKKRDFV